MYGLTIRDKRYREGRGGSPQPSVSYTCEVLGRRGFRTVAGGCDPVSQIRLHLQRQPDRYDLDGTLIRIYIWGSGIDNLTDEEFLRVRFSFPGYCPKSSGYRLFSTVQSVQLFVSTPIVQVNARRSITALRAISMPSVWLTSIAK